MKAIVHDVYGDASVLRYADADRPAIGKGDVLIRVAATALNIGDWHLMAGLPLVARLALGLRAPKARIRGMDVAGTVVSTGPGVADFAVGDEVFGVCDGGLAEFARASAGSIVHRPAGISAVHAAAIPTSATTALHALRESGEIEAGAKVLVIGAAGAVGSYAVQLAKAVGALVTGVCSASKAHFVRSLGASHVIDYARVDFTVAGELYDIIIDTAGNRPVSLMLRALAPTGVLVIVGGEEGGRLFGGLGRQLGGTLASPLRSQKVRGLVSLTRAFDLRTLVDLVETGKITPVIDSVFPLAEGADAMRRLESGAAVGKIVVEP